MKRFFTILLIALISNAATSQTLMEKYAQDGFKTELPFYMSETGGLNPDASIQFRNMVKDVAGYIIKEEKTTKGIDMPENQSINQVYDDFINNFLLGKKERKVSAPKQSTNGNTKFISTDVSFLDDETMIYYYYFVGLAETNNCFYKVVCFSTLDTKILYKTDFQKILLSLKDE